MPSFTKEQRVACPFFMPTEIFAAGGWPHPSRLPLGAGWQGRCSAPGHEGAEPTEEELRDSCNLGYAANCSRLPNDRTCDAVRFSVAQDNGSGLRLWFVCELGHRPAGHGTLEYDVTRAQWISSHYDERIQKMAECFVQSYLMRKIGSATAGPSEDANS